MTSKSMSEFKPKATILFLAYNQQDVVVQAAQSCLDQQGAPIEIILSDDCSTDSTYALLQQVANNYSGPHHVIVRQNARNFGIADHYNTLVKLAQGDLLITAAGDDISYPNRAHTLLSAWLSSGCKLDLVASYARSISYDGQETGTLIKVDQLSNWKSAKDWCIKRPYVVGATHAFTKRIWTRFGDIASDIPYEDQIVSLRAVCLGGGLTIQTPLLSYRTGGVSSKDMVRDSSQRLMAVQRRYSRQCAVFAQVRQDLEHSGHATLWRGKVKKYWSRAHAALELLQWRNKHTYLPLSRLLDLMWQCGPFWTVRQIIYTYKTLFALGMMGLVRAR